MSEDKIKISDSHKKPSVNLAVDTVRDGKQAIVFAGTKRGSEKTAEDIGKEINNVKLNDLSDKVLNVLSNPTEQCERLSSCVENGVAFHHSGLASDQRKLIEDNFREGKIKVICATPTLAYGVDTPAFRVIVKTLKRYSSSWGGMEWIPTLEYLQFAGRAGRPNFSDDHGEAVSVAKNQGQKEEIIDRYIKGDPEPIESKLAVEPVLRTYTLSLIATGFVNDKEGLIDFFSDTFWAHQYDDMSKLKEIINRMTRRLEEWNFIETKNDNSGFITASNIGEEDRIKATKIGKRVAELYVDPFTANHLIEGVKRAGDKELTSFSWLQLVSHTLEMRPLIRVKKKEHEDIKDEILEHYEELLEDEPTSYDDEYDEFMNSVKTALFLQDWISEKDEDYLLDRYDVRPGTIQAKTNIADWLFYTLEEIIPLIEEHDLRKDVKKMRERIQHGVKEELLPLIQLNGIGRVRARKLASNKIKDIGDLKKTSVTTLMDILGDKTAKKVKKQLGQEVEEVPENKRKGQINLNDYSD